MANNQTQSAFQEVIDYDVERRKRFVDLKSEDAVRLATIKDAILRHADEHADAFFNYLSQFEEAAPIFRRPDILREARRLKHEHLAAMVAGEYGKPYVEQRVKLAMIYSRAGIDLRIFMGAFHKLIQSIGRRIMEMFSKDSQAAFQHFDSLSKIAFFDIGIIGDVIIAERERTIGYQRQAILELSTPALQIRERMLMLPIIGLLDSTRAKQLTDSLLHAIRANRVKVVVMDITGVAAVDSKVANHLIQTVTAARLMGAQVIVTGLSAEVAQSLVALGVDLGKINTVGDLQGGIEEAERILGYKLVRMSEAPAHSIRS